MPVTSPLSPQPHYNITTRLARIFHTHLSFLWPCPPLCQHPNLSKLLCPFPQYAMRTLIPPCVPFMLVPFLCHQTLPHCHSHPHPRRHPILESHLHWPLHRLRSPTTQRGLRETQ